MRNLIAAATLALLSTTAFAKPNIVVIMTDDQDDIGSLEAMPNVKALIRDQGITSTNSFVFPLCGPARVSFLTGQYPHNHGITENLGAYQAFAPREGNSLGPWLQAAGYSTAFIGKTINDDVRHWMGADTGFGFDLFAKRESHTSSRLEMG